MFSQSVLDSMSIQELISKCKSLANEIDNRLDMSPDEALDYANALVNVSQYLASQIDDYVETFNEE